jgi:hypothetical protein
MVNRRSRRFAPGMVLDGGPLSYKSEQAPQRLSEEEEAATNRRIRRRSCNPRARWLPTASVGSTSSPARILTLI